MDIENCEELFNIENLIQIMEKKKKLNEYILIKKILPKIENLDKINIIEGRTYPMVTLTNYFLTYLFLHELLHLQNDIPKNVFDYFCYDILNKKEIDEKKLIKIIIKNEKLLEKNIINFDFSFKNFNIDEKKKFIKGSRINNFSFCFNNNLENINILKIFFLDNIKKEDIFLIKIPSITNIFITDVIKILCYIFDKNIIFKTIYDSMFKDSFNMLCIGVDLKKYSEIKKKIKSYKFETNFVSSIFEIKDFDNNYIFNNIFKTFQKELCCIIFTYINSLTKGIKNDLNLTKKNDEIWEVLNKYLEI